MHLISSGKLRSNEQRDLSPICEQQLLLSSLSFPESILFCELSKFEVLAVIRLQHHFSGLSVISLEERSF